VSTISELVPSWLLHTQEVAGSNPARLTPLMRH